MSWTLLVLLFILLAYVAWGIALLKMVRVKDFIYISTLFGFLLALYGIKFLFPEGNTDSNNGNMLSGVFTGAMAWLTFSNILILSNENRSKIEEIERLRKERKFSDFCDMIEELELEYDSNIKFLKKRTLFESCSSGMFFYEIENKKMFYEDVTDGCDYFADNYVVYHINLQNLFGVKCKSNREGDILWNGNKCCLNIFSLKMTAQMFEGIYDELASFFEHKNSSISKFSLNCDWYGTVFNLYNYNGQNRVEVQDDTGGVRLLLWLKNEAVGIGRYDAKINDFNFVLDRVFNNSATASELADGARRQKLFEYLLAEINKDMEKFGDVFSVSVSTMKDNLIKYLREEC